MDIGKDVLKTSRIFKELKNQTPATPNSFNQSQTNGQAVLKRSTTNGQ